MLYFNDCLQELLTLNAGIYNPTVRQAYDSLYEACLKQFEDHRNLLSKYATNGENELQGSIRRSVGNYVARRQYREALRDFITVARTEYRFLPEYKL